MTSELILTRKDKSKVKITVIVMVNFYKKEYDLSVRTKGYRKKKWNDVINRDCYRYRRMSLEQRMAFETVEVLKYVTETEINQALEKAWNSIKFSPYKNQITKAKSILKGVEVG